MTKRKIDHHAEWREEANQTFLSGTIAASSLQRLVQKAQHAGAQGAEKLAQTGKSGQYPSNVRRDFTRYLRRNSLWPNLYWAAIPLWDPKKEVLFSEFCLVASHIKALD